MCTLQFESRSLQDVPDTTLRDKVCQWLAAGQVFSLGTVVSSNKTHRHDITEILLKVALNTIALTSSKYSLTNEITVDKILPASLVTGTILK
jgi:hypothetical protein